MKPTIEVTLLGTGTAVPAKRHSPSGVLLQVQGKPFLFDIGPGTLARVSATGIDYHKLDTLFFSHLHPDHSLDLATLLQVFDSAPEDRRTVPFTLVGCKGLQDHLNRLLALYPEITPQLYTLNVHEVFKDEFSMDGLRIRTAPTHHTPSSIAYRLEADGKVLVYSGDASSSGELGSLSKDADVLISECSFPAGWQTEDHLNADSLGRLAQRAEVKKLIVTHRYPQALVVDLVNQLQKNYHGKIHLASDGFRFSL